MADGSLFDQYSSAVIGSIPSLGYAGLFPFPGGMVGGSGLNLVAMQLNSQNSQTPSGSSSSAPAASTSNIAAIAAPRNNFLNAAGLGPGQNPGPSTAVFGN